MADRMYCTAVSSEFARLNYSYDDKYLLTGIPAAGDEVFFAGSGSNNKYGYFPSAGVGWVKYSRENFWPTNKTIDFLKIRGSYGVTGNDNIPDFARPSPR